MRLKADFWQGRRVLLTGHTGFKGAWLSLWLNALRAIVAGYSLPPPTVPSLFQAARLSDAMRSIEGDLLDLARLRATASEFAPEVVFHLAAQALVRRSYDSPTETFAANLLGTVHLLEACRAIPSVRAIVVVTSDKCYEENDSTSPYSETDALGGHDPYSASKACAEIATTAYRRSFYQRSNVGIATARAGNVIGGGDWATDRLVPDLVRAFHSGTMPRLRYPGALRPWQHVLDPLAGYLILAQHLFEAGHSFDEAWNFGPSAHGSMAVGEIAQRIAMKWGGAPTWVMDEGHVQREARVLMLDPHKAITRLGWKPNLDLDSAVDWTVSWYKSYYEGNDARTLTNGQIARFMETSVE